MTLTSTLPTSLQQWATRACGCCCCLACKSSEEQSRERERTERGKGRQAGKHRRVELSRVESRPRLVSPSPSPSPRLAHSCFVSSRFVSSCCAYSFCCRGSQSSLSTLRRSVGRLSEWVVCALIVSAAAAAQHRQHRQRAA